MFTSVLIDKTKSKIQLQKQIYETLLARAYLIEPNKNIESKHVYMWMIDLSNITAPDVYQAKASLNDDELKKANNFINLDSKQKFILCRSIVKKLLSLHTKKSIIKFQYNEHGKPSLPDIEFNISHSHDKGLLGINNKPIGVDIELIEKNAALLEASHTFLNKIEQKWIGNSYIRLYKLWTLKEALLKCIGVGFSSKIPSFNVYKKRFDQYKNIETHTEQYKRYVLSIATIR